MHTERGGELQLFCDLSTSDGRLTRMVVVAQTLACEHIFLPGSSHAVILFFLILGEVGDRQWVYGAINRADDGADFSRVP